MDCFVPVADFDPALLKGSCLILPCVSLGNVPQLCTDLLISTLRLERVGFLNDPTVIPVVGPPAFGHSKDTLSLPLEVFQSPDHRITVIQQRAPSLPKQQRIFAANLVEFIQAHRFSHSVVLASVDASLRNDQQLAQGPFLLLPTQMTPLAFVTQATELGIGVLEKELTKQYPRKSGSSEEAVTPATANTVTLADDYAQLNIRDQSQVPIFGRQVPSPYLPGGAIARRLHQMGQERQLPLTLLLEFVSEGHNIPEAVTMANCLRTLLPSLFTIPSSIGETLEWVPPPSWDMTFYATQPPQALYQ